MPPKKAVQNNFPTNGYRRPLNPEFLKELVAAVRVGRSLSNIVNARRLQQLCNQSSEAIFALLDALLKSFFSGAEAAHLSFLLVGQHAIHPLSTQCHRRRCPG